MSSLPSSSVTTTNEPSTVVSPSAEADFDEEEGRISVKMPLQQQQQQQREEQACVPKKSSYGAVLLQQESNNNNNMMSEQQQHLDTTATTTSSSSCPICLEEYEYLQQQIMTSDDAVVPIKLTLKKCGHSFCQTCLVEHCTHSITCKQIPIPCPEQNSSNNHDNNNNDNNDDVDVSSSQDHVVPTGLVQKLVPEHLYRRYEKLYQLHMDPTLRECPNCESLQKSSSNNPSAAALPYTSYPYHNNKNHRNNNNNDITCQNCQYMFCTVHGNLHSGKTCAEFYTSPEAKQLRATEKMLSKFTKNCSHCGCHIYKAAGCDHVLCGNCHQDMCWKCGTHIYLTGKMVRHCSNCQRDYRDHRYDSQYRVRLCLSLPCLLPFVLVYIALALVTALVSGCFVGCFQCGRCFELDNSSSNSRRGGGLRKGFWVTVVVIFLPIIVLFEDFGIHFAFLEEIFPEPNNELPVWKLEDNPTNDDDDDDVQAAATDVERREDNGGDPLSAVTTSNDHAVPSGEHDLRREIHNLRDNQINDTVDMSEESC